MSSDRTPGRYSRQAGQSARERGRDLALGLAIAIAASGAVVLMVVVAIGWWSAASQVILMVWIIVVLVSFRRRSAVVERWLKGARGEAKVGKVIEQMRDDGWRAIHDVSFGGPNVDHVLIGPAGIFTIETKSHRGRIDVKRIHERMLRQAYAEAKQIEELAGRHVEPLLVFSNAYLVGRVPWKSRGVTILPARMLAGHMARRRVACSRDEVDELYRSLAGVLERGS